jgi:hypothetical protein
MGRKFPDTLGEMRGILTNYHGKKYSYEEHEADNKERISFQETVHG